MYDYLPPAGVTRHIEHEALGDVIATASLLSDVTMDFLPKGGGPPITRRVPRYSFPAITSDIRAQWRHGIASRSYDMVDGARSTHCGTYSMVRSASCHRHNVHKSCSAPPLLTLFVAGGWRSLPCLNRAMSSSYVFTTLEQFRSDLLDRSDLAEGPHFESAWDYLFTQPQVWEKLQEVGVDALGQICTAGVRFWRGSNWNTSSAAKQLFFLTNIPLVEDTFKSYKEAFIYGLGLRWDVPVPNCNLSQPCAEGVPIISPIALRAPENNHRGDSNNRFDRECRAWQQSLLHICRLLAFSGMAFETDDEESLNLDVDPNEKFLSAFHLAAHLEKRIENYRKSTSIRGSVQKPDQLFDKTDLQLANTARNINKQPSAFQPSRGKGGKGGFQGKGWKGRGRSFGGWNSYSSYSSYPKGKGAKGFTTQPTGQGSQ